MTMFQVRDSRIKYFLAVFGWFALVSETYADIMINESASTLTATSANNIGVGTTA